MQLLFGFGVFLGGSLVFGVAGSVFGLALLALAALWLALSWGLWSIQPWAWALGVVLAIAGIILNVLGILGGASIVGAIIPIAIAVAVLYYLNQPGIKSLFGRA